MLNTDNVFFLMNEVYTNLEKQANEIIKNALELGFVADVSFVNKYCEKVKELFPTYTLLNGSYNNKPSLAESNKIATTTNNKQMLLLSKVNIDNFNPKKYEIKFKSFNYSEKEIKILLSDVNLIENENWEIKKYYNNGSAILSFFNEHNYNIILDVLRTSNYETDKLIKNIDKEIITFYKNVIKDNSRPIMAIHELIKKDKEKTGKNINVSLINTMLIMDELKKLSK